ncbi:MAG: energy transducer TonB [Campylobacterales bacterium]|nr:energy transducer TonB [Campylobacterales bacterium]NQY53216.1 energy transducer TonB [Campylobacteraceae bacterium]
MRIILSIFFASIICILMFFTMHLMISSDQEALKDSSQTQHLVYLREKRDTKIQRKKRLKEKEIIKKVVIKKIKLQKAPINIKTNKNIKIKAFKMTQERISLSSISSLSGAQIEMNMGFLDANSLQTLRKVNPRYPRRAKIKRLSGFVKLVFTISKEGNVSNVRILDSNPKEMFEKSSIKAIKRWKFKASNENKDATITFNFRLAQ